MNLQEELKDCLSPEEAKSYIGKKVWVKDYLYKGEWELHTLVKIDCDHDTHAFDCDNSDSYSLCKPYEPTKAEKFLEKFLEKFPIGTKVRCDGWEEGDYVTVKAPCECVEMFNAVDSYGEITSYYITTHWQEYKEPEPQLVTKEELAGKYVDESFYCESCDYHKANCKCEKFKPLPEDESHYKKASFQDYINQNKAINALLRKQGMLDEN